MKMLDMIVYMDRVLRRSRVLLPLRADWMHVPAKSSVMPISRYWCFRGFIRLGLHLSIKVNCFRWYSSAPKAVGPAIFISNVH